MTNMTKLVYIGFAFQHHKGLHAGYHHIKDYIHYDKIIDGQKEMERWSNPNISIVDRIIRKIFQKTINTQLPFTYLRALCYGIFHKDCVFHFIYGENIYSNFGHMLMHNNKTILTLHQPFSWFDNNLWLARLRTVDNVILMSNKDVKKFIAATGKDNVSFIPHGIDTDFYAPDKNIQKDNSILMVGNWLRDFTFANTVFCKLLSEDSTLQINVVTNKDNFKYFTSKSRIHLMCGISDIELRNLYRVSKVLFLPLFEYTANNAFLEAVSTGCPVVIATDKPDYSYIKKDMIDVIPLNISVVVDYLKNNLFKAIDRDSVINTFSWKTIGDITKNKLFGSIYIQ